MIKRGPTHITDTMAVRKIYTSLPEDWLVRGLEERDYGIDLQIEIFDGQEPTGQIALIQVKGTEGSFAKSVKLQFPTKTIEYSLLFQEPFFVFHVSLNDEKIYYIWIQKYVSSKLEESTPGWRSQKTVTLAFPAENVFPDSLGKIKMIMAKLSARSDGLEFLAAYEWFKEHWYDFSENGNHNQIDALLHDFDRIEARKQFLNVYAVDPNTVNLEAIRLALNNIKTHLNGTMTAGYQTFDTGEIDAQVIEVDKKLNDVDLLREYPKLCVWVSAHAVETGHLLNRSG